MGQQREVLEDHAHLVAPDLDQFAFGFFQQIFALEDDLAQRWLHEA